jgi:hypothetical protein
MIKDLIEECLCIKAKVCCKNCGEFMPRTKVINGICRSCREEYVFNKSVSLIKKAELIEEEKVKMVAERIRFEKEKEEFKREKERWMREMERMSPPAPLRDLSGEHGEFEKV